MTSPPRNKLVLFDLDGTILSTMGAGLRAMQRAGRLLFGDLFDLDGVCAGGMIDPHLFRMAFSASGHEPSGDLAAAFVETYASELSDELERTNDDVSILPGMTELLDAVHVAEHTALGLLTGNYTRTGPIKLAAAGLDAERFEVRVYGDDGPDRPSLVPVGMARYAERRGETIESRDVIVVGDTPKDVECAHAHGALCLAVATGPYDLDALTTAGADMVLADLSDPGPLWAMLSD